MVSEQADNNPRQTRSFQRSLNWLVAAGVALYLVKELVTTGLGLDGLVYANLAKLLAADVGSFWQLPRYDGPEPFREHPPLGIWLLSCWMRLTGDAFWSEKAYSALVTVSIFSLTAVLWRTITGRLDYWWPWLLLALMPVSTFAMKNNYLESPLTLFALMGIWSAWKASTPQQSASVTAAYLALAATFCVLAGLSKGPAGLFVLAAPGIFCLARAAADDGAPLHLQRHLARATAMTLLITTLVGVAFYALLSTAEAAAATSDWWRQQLLPSITGAREGTHSRTYLLIELLRNLALPALIVILVARSFGRQRPTLAIGLLALALAASLPLLLSGRQFRYYLLPSLPLYALALALVTLPDLHTRWRPLITSGLASRLAAGLAAALVILTLGRGIMLFGGNSKDKFEMDLAEAISTRVAAGEPVGFCPDHNNYTLKAYLFRIHGIHSRTASAVSVQPPSRATICSTPLGANAVQLGPDHYFTPAIAPTASQ